MSGHNATEAATETATDDGTLPELESVRPRATTADGDPTVEIRFENGATICYRAADDGIEEAWIAPGETEPTRSHAADLPSVGDDTPTRSALSDRALCTVASYLSFDDRRRAAFSWGDANVSVLLGETSNDEAE
ncbi:uncharacterized protein Nmlp_3151 [Natronomonas moolapensis 8.8.11]|uniref:Halobacterial output domain-containing protein n=1 Tax=Natronomonas moolapensis (strain DSM 18674 / CECT 7526 / JCM 14361 / 8.8.11) TaxID=268739 RepID=M1Y436_NATM8|nr:hypothetical protein [Natronomonas moolapensis]CCQ37289.1 uncharacterized protein Nmlp_3151 [Natronomonas moolapensis 8.8.11]